MSIRFISSPTLRLLLILAFMAGALSTPAQSVSAKPLYQAAIGCDGIPQEECAALADLFNSTNGPGWTNNTDWLNWSGTQNPCSWYGVTCTEGHVSSLYLYNNQLSGPIPAELGSLTNLTYLNLGSNGLSGTIPVELGSLTNLTYLDLSSNGLSGTIPAELGSLTNLTYLGLSNNQLSGSILASLGSLTNLTDLFLSNNQLSGAIPASLGNLTNLFILNLSSNQLSGAIPASLGNLTNLVILNLSSNQLSGAIPTSITNLTSVLDLLMDTCSGLGSTDPAVISYLNTKSPGWNNCPSHSISGNTGVGGASLSYTDGTLKTAEADANGDYSFTVPYFWSGTVTPSKIGFGFTPASKTQTQIFEDLTGQNFTAVYNCADVTEIPSAECLALLALYNDTDGSNWTVKTDWLQSGTPCTWPGVSCDANQVLSISLPSNQLSGTIPPQLGDLTELQTLNLSSNRLTGSIPADLGDLTELQTLNLSSNQLTSSIPSDLGSLSVLHTLDLSANQLSGTIPPELADLTDLMALNLSSNQLTGSIPPGLSDLTTLTTLSLSSNHLTGTIPPELCVLSVLHTLDLSANQLSGTIPPELADLTDLMALNLGANQLRGTIPPVLSNLTDLVELNLGSNRLTGSIPLNLVNLTKLESLNLSSNQLTGTIPADLGDLTDLMELNLGSNHLTGTIPLKLTHLVNLETLNLSANQLTGTIPVDLGYLTDLSYLNLGFNQLNGSIPLELGSLTKLTLLQMKSNRLSGAIPAAITNLVSINTLLFDFCNGLGSSDPQVIAFLNDKADGWNACPRRTITGNAGLGGATLSYTDGSLKTAAADANGVYSFTVPYFWSGTVKPSKLGYVFNPAKITYTQVFADQTAQNFTARNIITFSSTAAQDGWVLESNEYSKAGGSLNAAAATLRLGDDMLKRQYRGILSFNTSNLPDNAVITKVTLKVKKHSITGGGDPLTTFQGFMVDIKKGIFGSAGLQTVDFQSPGDESSGPFKPALANGWYTINLTSGKASINKLAANSGLTQIRLYFKLDDNNNSIANTLNLYSGNAPAASRPQLVIQYYLP